MQSKSWACGKFTSELGGSPSSEGGILRSSTEKYGQYCAERVGRRRYWNTNEHFCIINKLLLIYGNAAFLNEVHLLSIDVCVLNYIVLLSPSLLLALRSR